MRACCCLLLYSAPCRKIVTSSGTNGKSAMQIKERQALIAQYAQGYAEVVAALEGFAPDHLTARPLPGKWTAAEIVNHLADSEMNSALRLRRLLTEENPLLPGYDQDFYAVHFRYNERPVAPALAALRGSRETSSHILGQMSASDWQRTGTHTESGPYTMTDWLRIYAAHAHNHAAQIRRLRAALDEKN